MDAPVSLWLLPDDEGRAALQPLLAELALALGGPSFEPHLTLVGRVALPRPAIEEALRRLAGETAPLGVATEGLEMQDRFFRALYVRLAAVAPLLRAQERAYELLSIAAPEEPFLPHVSLLYSARHEGEKRGWISRLVPRVPGVLRFNRLRAHETAGPPGRWVPVFEAVMAGPALPLPR
jgi:hypothetical protein